VNEPEQKLAMVHLASGIWGLSINLVADKQVTTNMLGIFEISGEENLFQFEEAEKVEDKAVELMARVADVAREAGITPEQLIAAVKGLGDIVEELKEK